LPEPVLVPDFETFFFVDVAIRSLMPADGKFFIEIDSLFF